MTHSKPDNIRSLQFSQSHTHIEKEKEEAGGARQVGRDREKKTVIVSTWDFCHSYLPPVF